MEITYTDSFERLLKEEAEKAESMSILHYMSYQKYNKLSMLTNIPVIILSGLVGFLSPIDLFTYQSIFLGSISVTIGIIKTLDSYMDYTKRTQTHYLTSLRYTKISKFIQIQLSLEKNCRIIAKDLLNVITHDMENISTSEPCISSDIIIQYNHYYGTNLTAKPSMCNGKLTNIIINKTETKEIHMQTDNIPVVPENAIPPDIIETKEETPVIIKNNDLNKNAKKWKS